VETGPANTIRAAFHYRDDTHTEFNHNRPTNANPALNVVEPKQTQSQRTWSIALEDTFNVTPDVDLIAGISYDTFDIQKAEEFDGTNITNYPLGGAKAFNWQGAAIWRTSMDGQLHASVSARSRFAGIWELYSTRFGTAIPNPDLGAERARNYEIGWQSRLGDNVTAAATIFYSDVFDLIQTVEVSPGMTQTQNVGDGAFYGFEASLDAEITPELMVGGNYTYIKREVNDALQPNLRVTGVPEHKAFLYATYRPIAALSFTPSLENASSRWSDRSTSPAQAFPYIRTGKYALVNVQAQYQINENFEIAAGVKNLLDRNYQLSWGYPAEGRNYFIKARATF